MTTAEMPISFMLAQVAHPLDFNIHEGDIVVKD